MRLIFIIPLMMIIGVITVKSIIWIRQGYLFDFLIIIFMVLSIIGALLLIKYSVAEANSSWYK